MNPSRSERMDADALLVGSLPLTSVDHVFRLGAQMVDGVAALPDGELGPRKMWVGFLAMAVYSGHPGLEATHVPALDPLSSGGDMVLPDRGAQRRGTEPRWTFRIKDGVERLELDLRYGAIAIDSYAIFRRLREQGDIAEGIPFQVCIPAVSSGCDPFFEDPDQWPAVHDAYARGVRAAIDQMLGAIPPDDLVIQYDLAWEAMDASIGGERYFPHWPEATLEEKVARHAGLAATISDLVPERVRLGHHWCYGSWGGWPMTEMRDVSVCVQLANETRRRTERTIDYVHMPATPDADEQFFAPLAELELERTRLFLGIVHETDGLQGFRRRLQAARRHVPEFGVSTACGLGRLNPFDGLRALLLLGECATAMRSAQATETRAPVPAPSRA